MDRRRGKCDEKHGQEAKRSEQDADYGYHAQCLERAILDAQADEVAVRTVAEEIVDVVGNGCQGGW